MGIALGVNAYGKAETRVVRVLRDGLRHDVRDRNVTTALHGDFDAAHVHGDQANVLPTDSQKNTVYAFAKDLGDAPVEPFALALARHFVDDLPPVRGARVAAEEYAWDRVAIGGRPHEHSFVRRGVDTRTTSVTVEGRGQAQRAWVVSGLTDLVVLKTTGSQFAGFHTDPYTTLPPTTDRILATSLVVRWRYHSTDVDWDATYDAIRADLLERYAEVHSLALQHTLWEIGRAVLERHEELAEIRLTAPNRHHLLVDLAPFGRDNPNEVFHAADRPYGLITASVERDGVSPAEIAWDAWPPRRGR